MKRKRIKMVVAELILATDNYTPEKTSDKKLQLCTKNNIFAQHKNNKNEYSQKVQEDFKRN